MPLNFWGTNRKGKYKKDVGSLIDSTPLLDSSDNFSSAIFDSDLGEGLPRESVLDYKQKPYDTTERFNKIFCSTWLGNDVVFGTKDNQMYLFETKPGTFTRLNVPNRPGTSTVSDVCGSHVATVNEKESKLVVGGSRPEDLAVFNADTLKSDALLVGHTDWVYGAEWIDSETLISGGRDKAVYKWSLGSAGESQENDVNHLNGELIFSTGHTPRAMKLDPYQSNKLYTTTSDGLVKTWDLTTQQCVAVKSIPNARETVCMAVDGMGNFVYLGGKHKLHCYDQRAPELKVKQLASLDGGMGIRSIELDGHGHLTIGGGAGRLSVLDTRKHKYVHNSDGKKYVSVRQGWFRKDRAYRRALESLSSDVIPSCVYSHCHHPTNRSVFVGGGPTMATMYGSAVSIFQ